MCCFLAPLSPCCPPASGWGGPMESVGFWSDEGSGHISQSVSAGPHRPSAHLPRAQSPSQSHLHILPGKPALCGALSLPGQTIPFLSLASGSWSCFRGAWALVFRSRHLAPVLSLLEEVSRFSQVPRVPFRAFALLSDPGRISAPSLFGASILPPLFRLRRLQR